jgi:hypothetical protein
VSFGRRLQRSAAPAPLATHALPSVRVAAAVLRDSVQRALAKGEQPGELVAIVNGTNSEDVRVTLGTRTYWTYVARHTAGGHAWLRELKGFPLVLWLDANEHRPMSLDDFVAAHAPEVMN